MDARVGQLSGDEADQTGSLLVRERFVVESAIVSDAFGDKQRVWARGDAFVRLTRDRGQWWCHVSRRGWSDWFDIDFVAGVCGSQSIGPVERLGDVIAEFADDQMLETLTARRDEERQKYW
jgi:hypothetical protein